MTVMAVMDAVAAGDPEALADGVMLMTVPSGPVDRSLLGKELDQVVLAPLGDSSLGGLQVGQLLRDLVGVMRRHGLRARPEVAALLQAVMTCESTARDLDPELSFRRVVCRSLSPGPSAGPHTPQRCPSPGRCEHLWLLAAASGTCRCTRHRGTGGARPRCGRWRPMDETPLPGPLNSGARQSLHPFRLAHQEAVGPCRSRGRRRSCRFPR